jgi:hypothetical protein
MPIKPNGMHVEMIMVFIVSLMFSGKNANEKQIINKNKRYTLDSTLSHLYSTKSLVFEFKNAIANNV